MLININGLPLDEWEPTNYTNSCLINHKTVIDSRTKKNVTKDPEIREKIIIYGKYFRL